MKKLPNLYKNNSKIPDKNQKTATLGDKIENIKNVVVEQKDINRKISNIFSSPKYVYKADVRIITRDGKELKKTIIGRTNNSIITIDDELINVKDITEISFLD